MLVFKIKPVLATGSCFDPAGPEQITCTVDTNPSGGFISGTNSANPNTDIVLNITSNQTVRFSNINVYVKNSTTGIIRTVPFSNPNAVLSVQIDLGQYSDPGLYDITGSGDNINIVVPTAFIIISQNSSLKLILPVSPITNNFNTLPELKITVPKPNTTYNIKLPPPWVDQNLAHNNIPLGDPKRNQWTSDAGGVIDAVNICNNGQADRTDCGNPFINSNTSPDNATYTENVYETDTNTYVGSVSFQIKLSSSSPSPLPGTGHNPCLDTNGNGKVDMCPTAIGNIPTNLGDFATAVLRIALGISGGIVLILMVIGSIRVMTSSGDPKNVAAGRDMIVAALAGALFIAFSVMIMQFFGTAIVPIPGLTYGT